MEIVAQTSGGFLINASENEIKEIINSVTGTRPEKLMLGQKIPAIDYASTITKIKTLASNSSYIRLVDSKNEIVRVIDILSKSIEEASKIQL